MVIDLVRKWNMKTLEPRSLLTEVKKEITIPTEIENIFNNWYKRIEKSENKVELLEIFYAGYILSNPVVREQYKEAEKLRI